MEYSENNHFDFMKLAITNQSSIRKPQVVFSPQNNLAIKAPSKDVSKTSFFKDLSNICMCEEQKVPIITLGSFSNGFNEGFDI